MEEASSLQPSSLPIASQPLIDDKVKVRRVCGDGLDFIIATHYTLLHHSFYLFAF
jgi:hypothetical protein